MVATRGGDKADKALAALLKRLSTGEKLRVGFLESSKYPDGTSTALVAAINNYGSARIPPRPFFSNMVKSKSPGWAAALGSILKATNNDMARALPLMGEGIKGQLQQSIRDTNDPPLAPSTVRAKGFDKPLINTGHMINSVAYEVKR
jgi:hypothetical protein